MIRGTIVCLLLVVLAGGAFAGPLGNVGGDTLGLNATIGTEKIEMLLPPGAQLEEVRGSLSVERFPVTERRLPTGATVRTLPVVFTFVNQWEETFMFDGYNEAVLTDLVGNHLYPSAVVKAGQLVAPGVSGLIPAGRTVEFTAFYDLDAAFSEGNLEEVKVDVRYLNHGHPYYVSAIISSYSGMKMASGMWNIASEPGAEERPQQVPVAVPAPAPIQPKPVVKKPEPAPVAPPVPVVEAPKPVVQQPQPQPVAPPAPIVTPPQPAPVAPPVQPVAQAPAPAPAPLPVNPGPCNPCSIPCCICIPLPNIGGFVCCVFDAVGKLVCCTTNAACGLVHGSLCLAGNLVCGSMQLACCIVSKTLQGTAGIVCNVMSCFSNCGAGACGTACAPAGGCGLNIGNVVGQVVGLALSPLQCLCRGSGGCGVLGGGCCAM
jgi:hypothetical protein